MAPTTTVVLPLETPIAQALPRKHGSPPDSDTVVSMLLSLTVDDDYFHRRALRSVCIQRSPLDDFLPQASEIVPGLFLSDMYTATSPTVLQHLGITHVASVLRKPPHRYPVSIAHFCVPVDDRTDTNLLDYLDAAVGWIDGALASGGRVLVHCVWGMSRSAAVVIAYLVAARALSLREAHSLARARRHVVRPNAGFMAQLKVYERVTRLREASARRVASSHADTDVELFACRVGMPVGVSTPA